MSYRAFKHLLGETSLERKCRFLFGAGILLLLHWKYAAGRGQLVPGQIDAHLANVTGRRIIIGIMFYAVATGLSFVSPQLSVALLVLLPFFYMRSSEIDRFLKGQRTE